MKSLYPVILVFLGGGIGATLRYGVNQAFLGSSFPISTLLVNVLGSLLLGLLWSLTKSADISPAILMFVGVGVLGGFTTFSGYSLESMKLIEANQHFYLLGSVLANNVLGFGFCAVGLFLGKQIS